jgi:hypothetical protein
MRSEQVIPLETAETKRGVSIWIKLFVAFHLVAITSWTLPTARDVNEKLVIDKSSPFAAAKSIGRNISDGTLIYNDKFVKASPLQYYLLSTGFWQYWDMFSPNPASIDFYGTATVTFQDGTSKLYQYPRMYDESISKKYVTERFRKFYERAHTESDKFLWPYFAQRVALESFTSPGNPPVKVVLTRHWLTVAAPGAPQQQQYNSYNYYTYTVDQEKLQKDAAGGMFG